LLKKLETLAERGIDGERISAQKKIARLKARLDFTAPGCAETPDLFLGSFKRSSKAMWIYSFGRDEFDVANSVKWAIESTTKIPCVYRDTDLLAEATVATANKLTGIATHITHSFRALVQKFSAIEGVSVGDRGVFVMGLYDGMMNEARMIGQRLPNRAGLTRIRKEKRPAVTLATNLHVHPYTVALNLGKQIRFSVPLEQIAAELQAVTQKRLTRETGVS